VAAENLVVRDDTSSQSLPDQYTRPGKEFMKSLDTHQKKTSFDCQVQEESKFSG
jgi:hypothetical protein